jgi:hypothetical protein
MRARGVVSADGPGRQQIRPQHQRGQGGGRVSWCSDVGRKKRMLPVPLKRQQVRSEPFTVAVEPSRFANGSSTVPGSPNAAPPSRAWNARGLAQANAPRPCCRFRRMQPSGSRTGACQTARVLVHHARILHGERRRRCTYRCRAPRFRCEACLRDCSRGCMSIRRSPAPRVGCDDAYDADLQSVTRAGGDTPATWTVRQISG